MNNQEELLLLQERIDVMSLQILQQKKHIQSLQELLGTAICNFFEISLSISETKKRFCYENVRECYGDLVYFYGSTVPLQKATDYNECYNIIFTNDYTNTTVNL